MHRNFVFTIGHSTRPIDDFIHLLKSHGVQRVVDVRTLPRSRFNPQFDMTRLPDLPRTAHLHYTHLPGLGGLRRPHPDSQNTAIDLIIVGTHGRNAFHRFLIGSVAERVMRTAPCPVLTIRANERDFIDAQDDADAADDYGQEARM